MYRYYSKNRPVSIGTYPRKDTFLRMENFDTKQHIREGLWAWGYIEYSEPLTIAEIENYELEGE